MRRRRHSLRYRLYLRSPLWRLRRRLWIIQALGRCERCGSRRQLTIHHRTYRRLGHERRADVAVLCWSCHSRHHAERYRPGGTDRHRSAEWSRVTRRGRHFQRAVALAALIWLPALFLALLFLAR